MQTHVAVPCLQLAAVDDLHRLCDLARGGAQLLDSLHNVHALGDAAKHNVLAVQPRAGNGGDEELRAVGVLASVGHRQQSGHVVSLLEVLILELGAVDGLTASTLEYCK